MDDISFATRDDDGSDPTFPPLYPYAGESADNSIRFPGIPIADMNALQQWSSPRDKVDLVNSSSHLYFPFAQTVSESASQGGLPPSSEVMLSSHLPSMTEQMEDIYTNPRPVATRPRKNAANSSSSDSSSAHTVARGAARKPASRKPARSVDSDEEEDCEGSGDHRKRHRESETRRRDRLRDSFDELSSLVQTQKKTRAQILSCAVDQLRKYQSRVDELQRKLDDQQQQQQQQQLQQPQQQAVVQTQAAIPSLAPAPAATGPTFQRSIENDSCAGVGRFRGQFQHLLPLQDGLRFDDDQQAFAYPQSPTAAPQGLSPHSHHTHVQVRAPVPSAAGRCADDCTDSACAPPAAPTSPYAAPPLAAVAARVAVAGAPQSLTPADEDRPLFALGSPAPAPAAPRNPIVRSVVSALEHQLSPLVAEPEAFTRPPCMPVDSRPSDVPPCMRHGAAGLAVKTCRVTGAPACAPALVSIHHPLLADVAVCLIALDGRFLDCNAGFTASVGTPREALLSTTIFDTTHPADVPEMLRMFQRMLRGEVTVWESSRRCIARQGEHTSHFTLSTVRVAGNPLFFVGFCLSADMVAARAVAHRLDGNKQVEDHMHCMYEVPAETPSTENVGPMGMADPRSFLG